MEEPVFVKCEPVRSSDTGEPSNFDNVHPMLGIIPLKQETKSELTESTQEYAFEENFQLLSEMKQETKSELIEPGTTQENAFEPSADIKDEIFVEQHQPLPNIKEENKLSVM
ncbi:uncharacterized protein [Anabrus simplex]|uniref:uncharacterized protein isoform X3 n=1 Tax=Anabrus simplex TaxID=316456 RepID=UPI0035A3ABAE